MITAEVEVAAQLWSVGFVAFGAVLGWAGSAWNARSARKHEKTMAAIERRQRRAETAAISQLAALHRMLMTVERTQPILEPGQDPPEPPSDDEIAQLSAESVLLSREVQAIVDDEWVPALRKFSLHAAMLRDMRSHADQVGSQPMVDAWGLTIPAQWRKVDTARREVRDAFDKIKEQVRVELEAY